MMKNIKELQNEISTLEEELVPLRILAEKADLERAKLELIDAEHKTQKVKLNAAKAEILKLEHTVKELETVQQRAIEAENIAKKEEENVKKLQEELNAMTIVRFLILLIFKNSFVKYELCYKRDYFKF